MTAEAVWSLLIVASGSVVMHADKDCEELTMTWLLFNIPLMVLFVALWVGIPMWRRALRGGGPYGGEDAAVV